MERAVDRRVSKPHDPVWSEEEYLPGRSQDALGMENFGEQMLGDLLPGINNQTRRARYYSFWAWVLHGFIHDESASHTQRGFYRWLRGPEAMLIFSHFAHGHESGVAGTNLGQPKWQRGKPETYPLDWESLDSVHGGAYELYYRGPLADMDIIRQDPEGLHDLLQRPVGTALAEAYGRAVGTTAYARSDPKPTQVTRENIEEFAQTGCLCRLPHFLEEREALIDAFFRFDAPYRNAARRLSSLCFFLDVTEQSAGAPLDTEAMRAIMYFWGYGTSHPYLPQGHLLDPAQRWRIFQLRQYFVFAIECFWALFLDRANAEPLTPGEYLGELRAGLDLAALGERFGINWPTTDPFKLTLGEFQTSVEDACPEKSFAPGPAALSEELNEHRIYRLVAKERTKQDADLWAGGALLMLSLMYRRCRDWRDDPGWVHARDTPGSDHFSVESYLRQAERAMDEGWTLAGWLAWLHQRQLWLRHRRVALQRMTVRREDPSLFTLDEGRFREVRGDKPKMNAPRFPSAFRVMEDLGIVRSRTVGGRQGYELLPKGSELLEHFRAQPPSSYEKT